MEIHKLYKHNLPRLFVICIQYVNCVYSFHRNMRDFYENKLYLYNTFKDIYISKAKKLNQY
ncbi:hypothetical protein QTP88_024275 [Uroleucon formosanum]